MESTKVKKAIVNNYKKGTDTEQKILTYIKKKKIPVSIAQNNVILYQEPGLSLKTFVPALDNSRNPSNDTSTIVLLTYGDFDMLFMADGGVDSFNKIKSYLPEDIEVIKTGHHGAFNTVNDKMLQSKNFDTAVISVGKNSYGHPSGHTINTLIDNGLQFFRTDVNNAIEVVTDGFSYNLSIYDKQKRKFVEAFQTNTDL